MSLKKSVSGTSTEDIPPDSPKGGSGGGISVINIYPQSPTPDAVGRLVRSKLAQRLAA